MLTAPRSGTENAQTLARQLGCDVVEVAPPFGLSRPAVVGASTAVAFQLQKLGGRWSRADRAITFMTWPQLESALRAVVGQA